MQMPSGIDGGSRSWMPRDAVSCVRRVVVKVSLVCVMLSRASLAFAQTPIVIGPTTTLQWDVQAPTLAAAQMYGWLLSVDGGSPLTLNPAGVTCVAGTPPISSCKILAQAVLPAGSHSLSLQTVTAAGTSLPSAPFAYLVVVIPVPQNLRFQ